MGALAGSTTPIVQTITVLAAGPSTTYTAAVRYFGLPDGWLSVSPVSGTTPAPLTLTANPSNLATGTYMAQVTVDVGPAHIGAWANVVFTIGSATGGNGLAVDPSSLTFAGSSVAVPQTLSVANPPGVSGATVFNAFANSTGNWLTLSPSRGITPAVLTVTPSPAALNTGIHTGSITIVTESGRATVVPITLVATHWTGFQTELVLTQTEIRVNHQTGLSGSNTPPVQTVGVTTNDGQVLAYTATSSALWIGLTSQSAPTPSNNISDNTPGQFNIEVNPAGLAVGSYEGSVLVRSNGIPSRSLRVSLTVSNTPALNAVPSSVVMDDASGATALVDISSTGQANLTFTATASTSSPWLNVTPNTGSTANGPQTLRITANIAGLTAGTYSGTVTLAVQGGGTLDIPVRLTTTGTDAGTLLVSPTTVELTAITGGPDPSPTATVNVVSGTRHPFTTAAKSSGWLSVAPPSGFASTAITITANKTIMPGTYSGSVVVTSLVTGEQATIDVIFNVVARALSASPTSLNFVQPQRGVVPAPMTIQVTANAQSSFTVGARPSWTRVSPLARSTPATLTVSVDLAGLTPGTYNGNIQLVGPNELTIPVSLTIPELPAPTATPGYLSFTYEYGGPSPQPQLIRIESPSGTVGVTASASTESGVAWLAVAPVSGNTPWTIEASINVARLIPGQHAGAITVVPADGSKTITIPITVRVTGTSIFVNAVLNSATYAPTPVSPGLLVTITGLGLGPVTGVAARPSAAGAYETQLAGRRVLFDGVPAPITYIREDQINAIVPYAVYGRLTTRMQVESGASFSLPVELKVVDAAPGIFTAGNVGRGPAAALNADSTNNSAVNPVPRGSVIVVYGTGEGQTDPPGQDGRIILTDLRRPLLPVTAKIGGQAAEVLYAGSASTLVSGTFQANIKVPENIGPGTLPIELQIGGISSQPSVTIEVR